MENLLLVGLSRQVTLERQLDVIANNIANVNTTGFKADKPLFQEYLTSGAHEDTFRGRDRNVSFVVDRATLRETAGGPLMQTKNPLDVAIDGNAYLVVQTPGGERYTRDGAMQINSQGQLVNSSGHQIVGATGPIVFQPTDRDITIAPDGTITVIEGTNRIDSVRGKLRLASFANEQRMVKEGLNLYSAGPGANPIAATGSQVQQGYIEKSNVNAVIEMTRMMDVTRAYTKISAMLQQQGDLRKTAIEKLADVPA